MQWQCITTKKVNAIHLSRLLLLLLLPYCRGRSGRRRRRPKMQQSNETSSIMWSISIGWKLQNVNSKGIIGERDNVFLLDLRSYFFFFYSTALTLSAIRNYVHMFIVSTVSLNLMYFSIQRCKPQHSTIHLELIYVSSFTNQKSIATTNGIMGKTFAFNSFCFLWNLLHKCIILSTVYVST